MDLLPYLWSLLAEPLGFVLGPALAFARDVALGWWARRVEREGGGG